ncbi:hypothetical protein FOL47_003467, partial [Perkinsus chesapeaki]
NELFKDHELQLIIPENVVNAKAFEDLVRDQNLRGPRIFIDRQDLQPIRELKTEGAIEAALDSWIRSTTCPSNDNPQLEDQDLSAEDSTEEVYPSTITQQADPPDEQEDSDTSQYRHLSAEDFTEEARPSTATQQADHPPDKQGDSDTCQDSDPDVPIDKNLPLNHITNNQDLDIESTDDPPTSISPRPRRRHRRAKGKVKREANNRNDLAPTYIKITRPILTNLTGLRRHLP